MSDKEIASGLRITVILLAIFSSCSPSNTKISAVPAKVGFKAGNTLLIIPLSEVTEQESEQLIAWATDEIESNFPKFTLLNYWDSQYKSKQNGVEFPAYNLYDTSTFTVLNRRIGIDFVLLSRLDKLNENYKNELNNPNYQRREATMAMQLLDLENGNVVWSCTAKVFVNPLKAKGGTQTYSINVLSGGYAVNKAFKASIIRLKKSLVLVN